MFLWERPATQRRETLALPWLDTEATTNQTDLGSGLSRKRSRDSVELEEEMAMIESKQQIETSKQRHAESKQRYAEFELQKLKLRQEQRKRREGKSEKRVKLEPISEDDQEGEGA